MTNIRIVNGPNGKKHPEIEEKMKNIFLIIFISLILSNSLCFGGELEFEIVGHHDYGYLWKFNSTSKNPEKFENFSFNPRSAFLDLLVFEDGTTVKNRFFQWSKPGEKFIHGSFSGTGFEYFPGQIYSCDISDKYSPWYDTTKNGNYFVLFIVKKGKQWNDGLWFSNILEMEIVNRKVVSSSKLRYGLAQKILDGFQNELNDLAKLEGGVPEKIKIPWQ